MRSNTCTADCNGYVSMGCSAQLTAALNCADAVPDATYCNSAGTTCGTQYAAVQTCFTGGGTDGGGGDH
jgi:hypothetical protein